MPIQHSNCNDHWCEDYGKGNEKCGQCVKKYSEKDRADLKVMLKRRADKLMEIDRGVEKRNGQDR